MAGHGLGKGDGVRGAAAPGKARWAAALRSRLESWRSQRFGEVAWYPHRSERQQPDDAEVAEAWVELRHHPALSWVPPMWRTGVEPDPAGPHSISAIDKNLFVEIRPDVDRQLQVRLQTGPLQDRRVGDGVDPTTPVGSVDPDLTVSAPTFERAVLELRDAVRVAYGEPRSWERPAVTDEDRNGRWRRLRASGPVLGRAR